MADKFLSRANDALVFGSGSSLLNDGGGEDGFNHGSAVVRCPSKCMLLGDDDAQEIEMLSTGESHSVIRVEEAFFSLSLEHWALGCSDCTGLPDDQSGNPVGWVLPCLSLGCHQKIILTDRCLRCSWKRREKAALGDPLLMPMESETCFVALNATLSVLIFEEVVLKASFVTSLMVLKPSWSNIQHTQMQCGNLKPPKH